MRVLCVFSENISERIHTICLRHDTHTETFSLARLYAGTLKLNRWEAIWSSWNELGRGGRERRITMVDAHAWNWSRENGRAFKSVFLIERTLDRRDRCISRNDPASHFPVEAQFSWNPFERLDFPINCECFFNSFLFFNTPDIEIDQKDILQFCSQRQAIN